MSKPRILLVGAGDDVTGFSRVLHSIARPLSASYEIHHLARNLRGPAPTSQPWTIHPNNVHGDRLAEVTLGQLVESLRPHLVWVIYDFWLLANYRRVLRAHAGRFKTVAYMPLDGRIIRPQCFGQLNIFDTLVVYNEFARRETDAALEKMRTAARKHGRPRLLVIPHGVEQELFRPLACGGDASERRREARRRLFGAGHDSPETFIVLNANQNTIRKRLDLTMQGFAIFARDKPPGVKLYLHCAADGTSLLTRGINVHTHARRLGIADRLILTGDGPGHPSVSDERLNLIYNACDVGINTSWGEGWGLVSFEHAATGAAQIVPRHTACAELWPGAAEFLETAEPCISPRNLLLEARPTTQHEVAAALERLYGDREHREALARAAYRNATRPELLWSNIARRWDELFRELLEEDRPRTQELTNAIPETVWA